MEDIKNSSLPYADILFRVEQATEYNWSIRMDNPMNAGSTTAFLMVNQGADLRQKTDDVLGFFKERYWIYKQGMRHKVGFEPLENAYFSGINMGGMLNSGNKRFVIILMSAS